MELLKDDEIAGKLRMTAEYHNGYVYLSCITSGLYIVQLDLDVPYVNSSLAVSED